MKIVVTGAAGMLGQRVAEALAQDHEVVGAAREEGRGRVGLDVTRLAEVRALLSDLRPDVVVHCAAYTAVDACEDAVERSFRVNALGARNVAIGCREADAAMFHVSTDYVFDGEKEEPYVEDDEPRPDSVYGRSKLAGERYVRDFAGRWYIGRVQWLYGEGGKNFADTILRLSREREVLAVVDDQRGCPTYTRDAARQIKALVESGEYGLYHMSAKGETTWYGFTRELLRLEGRGDFPVEPVTTDQMPRRAPRPKNSVMRNLNLELTIGDGMRDWREGAAEFMARRRD